MRSLVLPAVVAGLLKTASAQIPENVQSPSSPRLDSLRRALKLSPDMRLDWITSPNGVDTFRLIDDFNRTKIGPDWACDESLWKIVDGELSTSSAATEGWRYLAVFLPVFNDSERQIQSVSYRWGRKATADGIREGAMALMLDAPSRRASGYWLWHRYGGVWLWIIKDGAWEYRPREGKEVDRQPGLSDPVAGDVVTGVVRNESDAVYFDYYINGRLDATVKDATKKFPQSDPWYVGLFLRGEQVNNWVDDFAVTWTQGDNAAPAAVTDLRAVDSTVASVKLEWTSTGDNDFDGRADHFELRYSTSPITSNNFSEAALASNLSPPVAPGQQQEFTVTGLKAYTAYYFAIKIFDEVNHASPLSNVVQAKTLSDGVAKTLTLVDGCGQTGVVNDDLPVPLTARVTDANGVAVSNSPVQFVIVSGNGAVDGKNDLTVSTDANGEAKATWKLGTVAGTQEMEIRAEGLDGSPDTCTAIAKAAAPAKIIVVSGSRQVVPIGKLAPQPLMARLEDHLGNGVVDYSMIFTITAGGGSILNDQNFADKIFQTLTDSSGIARARVVASNLYGDTTKILLNWTGSNGTTMLGPCFFVVAARPDSVAAIKGNNQTAAVGTAVAESLVVQVVDELSTPVRNYPVMFHVLSGGGMLANNETQVEMTTDTSGYARMAWTLGATAGEQQVEASAAYGDKNLRNAPVVFKAIATTRGAKKIELHGGNQQKGLVNHELPQPLIVQILDEFDNPTFQTPVEFTVLEGGGRIVGNSTVISDSNGLAQAIWQLGPTPGLNKLQAYAEGLVGSPLLFVATAVDSVTAVHEEATAVPNQFALHQNFPNPFWSEATSPARSGGNPETTISFDLPEASQVEMNVYDVNGRRVRQLLATQMPAGAHRVLWNSRDDNGHAMNSGIYFLVLRARVGHASGEIVATRKIILMK